VAQKRHLKDILASDKDFTALIPARELETLFDPMNYQGVAQELIDRLLKSAQGPTRR
jgi:3-carboxy-cis,cis-muconate cycloisomerase